ncbi:hypothetical protein [Candidatus Pelagibacter communis]|uniref:hypothetical protein n=1 Tax=Candidatus Pelagibacter TaxID=198251 RepID=UPI003EE1FB2C
MKKFILILFVLSLSTQVKAEVTYLEILKNPTDLRLNLQYAKEQEALGEFKSVIATLERLTALYPTNIDLKLYLLSIAVKTDSTEKVLRLIEEIRQSDEITEDVKTRVAQVFDDINKKRIDDEKTIARQKARQVVEEEEKKRSQVASKENKWTFYQDIGWKATLHSNIGNVSSSKTQYSGGSIVAMSGVEGDNIETINTVTGAIYQINDTSNISLSVGTSSSEQNRGTTDENDTNTFSSSYSKFFERNSFSASYSFTDTNTRRAADTYANNLSFNNTFSLNENHRFNGGITLGTNKGNQNPSNATRRNQNTWKQGFTTGYDLLMGEGAQHKLSLKYTYTDTHAIANHNALDDHTYSISYTENTPWGNFTYSYSESDKDYDTRDSFVSSAITRREDSATHTVSMNGSLGQIARSMPTLELPSYIMNQLNTLTYNMSWSETENDGSLLQHNYEKETFNFGITKRIYY